MQNGISGLSCNAKVWGLGAAAGVVFFLLLLLFGVGTFAAFVLGLVLCVAGGIAGRGLYCGEMSSSDAGMMASEVSQPMPEPGPAPEPVPGPEPATAPEPPRAAEPESPASEAGETPSAEEVPASAAVATPEAQAETLDGQPSKPETLPAPRGGEADDLKQIKGLGPKLEEALNGAGIYHFDQIAAWSADEVAWVDENIDGVRGRASRDDWVEQARALTATPQG